MKRLVKHISIPIQVWEHGDLTIHEKWVLLAIDMYSDENGASIGVQTLSTETGLPNKEIKTILKSLFEKKAIQVSVDENGAKRMLPLLFKERYLKSTDRPELEGVKPEPTINIDYEEVAQKWNEIVTMLPPIQRWSPSRKSKLRTSIKQAGISISELYKIFWLITKSSFLNGSSQSDWSANFDWLIKSSTNLIKVLEGNYHNKNTSERLEYERIMQNKNINQVQEDSFYR